MECIGKTKININMIIILHGSRRVYNSESILKFYCYVEQIFQENQPYAYDVKKLIILSTVSTFLLTSITVFITGCTFGYCLGHKCKKKINESHTSQNTDIELEENVAYSIT